MKKIVIKETMFGGGVTILICAEQEFVYYIYKEYGESLICDGSLGQFYRPEKASLKKDKKTHNYIWLSKLDNLDDFKVLIHELQHFIIGELNRRGIPLIYDDDSPVDEIFAYFAEEVLMRTFKKVCEIKLKK